jgi:hypothetical protein
MSLEGAVITAGNPGANVRPADRRVSALIGHGVAVVGKIALGDVKIVYSLKDAEVNLGLNAAYDAANVCAVWYSIKEFYRKAPSGSKLYIMLVNNANVAGVMTVKMVDILQDAGSIYAKKLIQQGAGEIYQLGVMFNPSAAYVSVLLNGLDADVYNSISHAEALYEWADAREMRCNIVLEGYNLNGTAAAAQDLKALPASLKARHTTIVIGQDYDYCEALDALGKKHAAVGTALGSIAYARISQNIGDCEDETLVLSDTSNNFKTPGLSDHTKCVDRGDDLVVLDNKAYLFAYNIIGLAGARWNGDPVCAPAEVDAEGIQAVSSISDGRTMDEIRRRLRSRMLPKVRTNQRLDPATGKLAVGTVQAFNKIGDQVFDDLSAASEISGGVTQTDPNSNLLVPPRILTVGFSYVKIGQIDKIVGKVNIKTSL